MQRASSDNGSAAGVAIAGLVALAVAMGIGRFAFTPIMPVMEADAGLTLRAAGWLAAANYLGYFLGALCAARLPRTWAIRGGLLLIVVVTFAMGVTHVFALQMMLRLAAGVASAWVLVHVSSWALERLLVLQRPQANGVVFAGVGVGIAGAGLLCMALMDARVDSQRTWETFGVVSALFTAMIWTAFRDSGVPEPVRMERARARRVHWNPDRVRLASCYAALGFGYIIPATFLPAMAHRYITDPAIFGWAWPVFGAAAALSTWAASRWLHAMDNRRLWAISYVLMAIGVALPALWPALTSILIAALLVGGTFMVVTMLGLREARTVAGDQATGFIAAITAAFAVAQIIGPLVVSVVAHLRDGFAAALAAAALVLLVAAVSLWRSADRGPVK
ncbi:MAG: YbfB/YjiJ family MFS transporter [Xanthomonadaceae bacterium]|nr:YbfB/YjiJ family MFS transporter [Xanthomonadaceae bacterium]